jgi:hypothetical protein
LRRISIVSLLLAIVTLVGAGAKSGESIHDIYRIRLAALKSIPNVGADDTLLKTDEDQYLQLVAHVDSRGAVTDVGCEQVMSTGILERLNGYFKRLVFVPGTRHDSAMAQSIPFTVYLYSDNRPPKMMFPVDSSGLAADPDLYTEALEQNGVVIPKIKRFPWYHYVIKSTDTMPLTRFVLGSMSFSAKGTPTRIELAGTNQTGFAGQIINAANWGKYSAATIDGKPATGFGFLMMTFYPTIHYPTKPFKSEQRDSILTLERLSLKMLPDTLGLLMKPVPRFVPGWLYELTVTPGLWNREGVFRFAIDTVGRATLMSGGNGSAKAKQFGQMLALRMRFYPSINNNGRPVAYEGAVRVVPSGKQHVRVQFLWLE